MRLDSLVDEEAVKFAKALMLEFEGLKVQVVEL